MTAFELSATRLRQTKQKKTVEACSLSASLLVSSVSRAWLCVCGVLWLVKVERGWGGEVVVW